MSLLALSLSLAFVQTTPAAVLVSDIVCIPLEQCPSFDRLTKDKPVKPEALEFILSSTCAFDGLTRKVWCPKIETKETPASTNDPVSTDSPIATNSPIATKSPIATNSPIVTNGPVLTDAPVSVTPPVVALPSRVDLQLDECGKQVEDRIVGGTKADIDEFPWMAVLQYKKRQSNKLEARCAGALISNRYVLTAAHCITLSGKPERIVLGDYHILNETDCVMNAFGDKECAPPAIRLLPEDIKVHPGWDVKEQRPFYNDIALIRLSAIVEFSDFVRPICLPKPDEVIVPEKNFTVAGWGLTEKRRRSNIKLKVQVPATSTEYCSQVLGRNISERQICAGGRNHQDSCRGDSGGPLMSVDLNTGLWYTTGIVSLGTRGCANEGIPAIYTFVPKYLGWILDNLRL